MQYLDNRKPPRLEVALNILNQLNTRTLQPFWNFLVDKKTLLIRFNLTWSLEAYHRELYNKHGHLRLILA